MADYRVAALGALLRRVMPLAPDIAGFPQETVHVVHTAHIVEGDTFHIPTVGIWKHEPTPIPTPEGLS